MTMSSSAHQQPAQMNHSSHSPANSRPSSLSHTTLTNNYHTNHYGSVKVEDDHYGVSVRNLSYYYPPSPLNLQSSNHHHHHNGQSNHYHTTLPPFAHTVSDSADMDSWHAHTYSAERGGQVHR